MLGDERGINNYCCDLDYTRQELQASSTYNTSTTMNQAKLLQFVRSYLNNSMAIGDLTHLLDKWY